MDPVVIEIVRGDMVESVHRARLVVTNPDGSVRYGFGDYAAPMFPRSATKPMQAIAMLEAGLDLDGHLLALAAASHLGEPFHIEGVREILASAGRSERDLQNTPDFPLDETARIDWIRAGRGREPIAMNCSGKHAAMLRTCVRAGLDTPSYLNPRHPLQTRIREVVGRFADETPTVPSVDGCGAPVFGTSLTGLARSYGRIASATSGPAAAVAAAFRAHPEYPSGSTQPERLLHDAVPGLVCKGGAEASIAAGLADGTGIALKMADGMGRGRIELFVAVLRALGIDAPGMAPLATTPVLGHGEPVGVVRAVPLSLS
ncbi:MAG TPA: asparaginase [Propionibacteriaceae bacterium]|nr:asparaginase [Propionibacteriaceae bacterium]